MKPSQLSRSITTLHARERVLPRAPVLRQVNAPAPLAMMPCLRPERSGR
jgi:hypothetical protein